MIEPSHHHSVLDLVLVVHLLVVDLHSAESSVTVFAFGFDGVFAEIVIVIDATHSLGLRCLSPFHHPLQAAWFSGLALLCLPS